MVYYYQMDTPQVHGAGQQVAGLTPLAGGLARRYGTVLSTAANTVRHPTVAGALRRFSDRWHPPAELVAGEVSQLGERTSGSAVVITETDLVAEQTLATTGEVVGAPSHLNRSIN